LSTVARAAGWSTGSTRAIGFLVLPLAVYVAADAIGGNGFIAAFVAGTATAAAARWIDEEPAAMELTETGADLLGFGVWFVFGLVAVPLIAEISAAGVVFAIAALTVLRMLPVAICLIGSGLRLRSVAFIGWFGPRGLASMVFALLALDELQRDPALETVVSVIGLTVLLSVVAHGLTAGPWARGYGDWVQRTQPPVETSAAAEPRPPRGLFATGVRR
jgi:sodium/hydrogen antiporter